MTCNIKGCQNVLNQYQYWCNTSHRKLGNENERNSMIDDIKGYLERHYPNIDFPIRVSWTETYQKLRGSYKSCSHEWIVVNGSKIRWKVHTWETSPYISDWDIYLKAGSIIRKKIKERKEEAHKKEYYNQRQIKTNKEYEEAVAKNTIEWNKINKYIASKKDGRSYNRYNESGTQSTKFTEELYVVVKGDVTIYLKKAYKDDMSIEGIKVTGLTTGDVAKKLLEDMK
jgi:hypothetical protein